MFQARATPWRAKSALQNHYNSKSFSYFGPSEPTLDLRLLQPPDLHHFLGNCPGRSQKFVAPHSEHAYFGTSPNKSQILIPTRELRVLTPLEVASCLAQSFLVERR